MVELQFLKNYSSVISSGVEIVFISLYFDIAQYRLAQGDIGGITISKELQFCHIERSRDYFHKPSTPLRVTIVELQFLKNYCSVKSNEVETVKSSGVDIDLTLRLKPSIIFHNPLTNFSDSAISRIMR